MVRWFLNNVGLMVLALIFGFGAWTISTLQDDPIVEDAVPVRVVKVGENQLGDRVWTGTLPLTVTTRIRAPRSTLSALAANGMRVEVDLRKLDVGDHVVPLTPTLTISPAIILSSSPVTALITIQRMVQLRMPVRVSIVGVPALGFRAGIPTLIPQQVIITGSQQVISQVASVTAIVSVDGARSSVEQETRAFARDANGDIVTGAQLTPDSVSVRVPMEQLSNYRDLAVVVKRRGQPAEGYAVADISVDPVIVTVFGPVDAVQASKGYIETMDVVLDNAQADIDERVALNVPQGVTLVSEDQTVRVRIRIQPLMGSRTIKRKAVLIGGSGILSSTISPDTVDVVLNGPLLRLNNLTDEDVRVELNITGLAVGIHQLTPNVIVPQDITAQSVVPTTIQVELKPPPTPEVTPTASP